MVSFLMTHVVNKWAFKILKIFLQFFLCWIEYWKSVYSKQMLSFKTFSPNLAAMGHVVLILSSAHSFATVLWEDANRNHKQYGCLRDKKSILVNRLQHVFLTGNNKNYKVCKGSLKVIAIWSSFAQGIIQGGMNLFPGATTLRRTLYGEIRCRNSQTWKEALEYAVHLSRTSSQDIWKYGSDLW